MCFIQPAGNCRLSEMNSKSNLESHQFRSINSMSTTCRFHSPTPPPHTTTCFLLIPASSAARVAPRGGRCSPGRLPVGSKGIDRQPREPRGNWNFTFIRCIYTLGALWEKRFPGCPEASAGPGWVNRCRSRRLELLPGNRRPRRVGRGVPVPSRNRRGGRRQRSLILVRLETGRSSSPGQISLALSSHRRGHGVKTWVRSENKPKQSEKRFDEVRRDHPRGKGAVPGSP